MMLLGNIAKGKNMSVAICKQLFQTIFLLSLAFHSITSLAQQPVPYSQSQEQKIINIFKLIDKAKVEDLKGSGPIKRQILFQAITSKPDPKEYPLIGYGHSMEEAHLNAIALCIKWSCSTYPGNISNTTEEWKNMSAEKLMDYYNAQGKLEIYPDELKNNPEKFKEHILSQKLEKQSCSTFNNTQILLIYGMCASAGATIIED